MIIGSDIMAGLMILGVGLGFMNAYRARENREISRAAGNLILTVVMATGAVNCIARAIQERVKIQVPATAPAKPEVSR